MERLNAPTAETIDLADIFRSIRNGWRIILGITLITTAMGIAVLLYFPPSYSGKASVVLRTGSGSGQSGGLAAAIGTLTEMGGSSGGGALSGLKSGIETEVEILKSRALAAAVVDSLDLQAVIAKPAGMPTHVVIADMELPGSFKKRTYEFEPVAGAAGEYRFIAPGDSGRARAGQPTRLAVGTLLLAATAPKEGFKITLRDKEDATTRLVDRFTVEKPKSEVAHMEYRGDDSLSAAAVPNLLVQMYMDRRKGVDRGTNQKRAEFLAAKVDSVGKALSTAEHALRAERESSGLIDPELVGRVAFENENRARAALTELQVQEGALQQLVADVKAGTASPRQLASYPPYLGAGPVSNIVSTLIGVETERLSLLGEVTEEDARVKALAVRAKNLEAQLLPLAQTSLAALATQREALQSQLRRAGTALVGIPGAAESYGRLQRDILERGKIYAGLQAELVAARLAAISEGGDVRPLDVAVVQKKRAFPKPSLMLAGGVGGGLFLGTIVAVLVGLIGGSMHDAQDVERRTGLPAVRYERTAPLLVGGAPSKTVLVAPIDDRGSTKPVAERLVETAISRSMTATLLDLSDTALKIAPASQENPRAMLVARETPLESFDANAAIRRLEDTHDMVVVRLPALTSHQAAAVLSAARPVLLVAPERRIERRSLQNAIDLLRRVGAPCAGVVLHGDDRRTLRG
jgi:tyrosine-protein kinase Etk/Wzc